MKELTTFFMISMRFVLLIQQKRKLRIYISNTYTPGKPEGEEAERVSSWELRVEGKLLEDVCNDFHYVFTCWHVCELQASLSNHAVESIYSVSWQVTALDTIWLCRPYP